MSEKSEGRISILYYGVFPKGKIDRLCFFLIGNSISSRLFVGRDGVKAKTLGYNIDDWLQMYFN